MSSLLQTHAPAKPIINNRRLISGLKHALDMNYARVMEIARKEWEHTYAGKDPSDACVSVRISSGNSGKNALPCGGILKKPRSSLLNGNRSGLLA
jgi:hypothetical protein